MACFRASTLRSCKPTRTVIDWDGESAPRSEAPAGAIGRVAVLAQPVGAAGNACACIDCMPNDEAPEVDIDWAARCAPIPDEPGPTGVSEVFPWLEQAVTASPATRAMARNFMG